MQHEQHRPGGMLAEYAALEGRPRLLSESLRGIGRAAAP
jgi:hypothetical protein